MVSVFDLFYIQLKCCRKISKFEGLAIGGLRNTDDLEKPFQNNLQKITFDEGHVMLHKGYMPCNNNLFLTIFS